MARIAIIGLGYIGGSIGMGLRAARLRDTEIVGFDDWRAARNAANKQDAVDQIVGSPREAVDGAGLVILATPPAATSELLQEIAPGLGRGAAVTDTAASKVKVGDWADQHLPRGVSFIGGHPMAGDASAFGVENASADLFQGKRWFVSPSPSASDSAVKSVLGMVRELGATPHFLDPEEHDFVMAGVSHLPLVASYAMFTMLRGSDGWPDFGRAAGETFRTMTAFNSGDPSMTTEIAVTNRDQIKHWIDRYVLELNRVRNLLDEEEEDLFREYSSAQINHAKFLGGDDLDPDAGAQPDIPDATSQMAALLISPRLYEKVRQMTKRTDEKEKEREARGRRWGRR
ncbi:MAG: prephenate dehydrogenase [Gemmatimonadetes bacterium]|nr:prephenate dehydrogenase [Gemmatimonadota bacterium]